MLKLLEFTVKELVEAMVEREKNKVADEKTVKILVFYSLFTLISLFLMSKIHPYL